MKKILATLFFVCCALMAEAQCTASNNAFKAGEILNYDLYFNWKFVWVKAGTATMDIKNTRYGGKPAFRCHLISRGSKQADHFFVMRDTLESIVSTDMSPLYFRKGAEEGKRYKVDEIWYSYPDGNSHIKQRYKNSKGNVTTHNRSSKTSCIYDMLSMLLRARSFEASSYRVGQKIKFLMADGDEVEEQTLVYRGKDKFKMDGTKITYRCLVFSFVEYEKGKEKEVITFYVTDDANHLPVRLDLFLSFGTAKAFLRSSHNVRHPMTSVIK